MRAFLLLIALTACATVTKDTEQRITVATDPAGASCSLRNGASDYRGEWTIDNTPGSAVVRRHFSPLTITCTKDGKTATTSLEPKTRGRAYGNILLGGVPAIVDAETGAGYEYGSPEVTLELK